MEKNSTAAKRIKKYCYVIGLLSFLAAFLFCSVGLRYQEMKKKGKWDLSGRKYCTKSQGKAGKIRNGFSNCGKLSH